MTSDRPQRDPSNLRRNSSNYRCYVLLLVPIIFALVSLYVPPTVISDSGVGFLALENMLRGGGFNKITAPNPANIANDLEIFVIWWSPGQYLVPGIFIWLGTNYGTALSLTTLIATLIGLVGWIQVARSFGVSSFVVMLFISGLVTFPYVSQRFLGYWGGEVLLFATTPWSLYAMRWAADKSPILCFTVSFCSALLLFFAKLTGVIVFAANVVAISVIVLANRRRPDFSILAMWIASAMAALGFLWWVAQGPMAADVSSITHSWFPMLFSVAAATFSGIYGLNLIFGHSWMEIDYYYLATILLAPLGFVLMIFVWYQLYHTRYRNMAVLLLTIILVYAVLVAITLQYFWGLPPSFDDRHFRYAGILFFLLLLTAVDQWRIPVVNGLLSVFIVVLGFYSLRNYIAFAHAQMHVNHGSGIVQFVSPAILEYMRADVTRHNFQRPIAVIPEPSAAISLPGFRFILFDWERQHIYRSLPRTLTWAGRAAQIYLVMPEEMAANGKAHALLSSFTNYPSGGWNRVKLDKMIIYSQ